MMKMNKDLRLLLISMVGMFLVTILLYFSNNFECKTFEYQNLSGTHKTTECYKKPPANCWSKYATEQEAIMNCEGEP